MFSQRCWRSLARPYRRCGKYSLMNVISISPRKSARPPDAVWSPLWEQHVNGIRATLLANQPVALECLETVPPASQLWRWLGWGIPALIVGSLFGIAWQKGAVVAGSNALFWILATGILCSGGAVRPPIQ